MIRMMCNSWSWLSRPLKSGAPEIISANIQPHDQTSMDVLYVREPSRTSGARYQRVTTCQTSQLLAIYADTKPRRRTSFENVFTGTPNALARPKSPSFNSPLRLIRRFWGFKSRCRTWFSWQKAVPFNNWNMKLRTVFGSSAPRSPCWSMYFLRSCSQYSKIRTSFVSVCITSCRRTMLTCLSSFIRDISRIAVDGVPSSASRWISFNATISFVVLERPL